FQPSDQFSAFFFLFVLNQNRSLCNSKSHLSSFLFLFFRSLILFVPPSEQNLCVSNLQRESERNSRWKSNFNPVLGDNSMQIRSATQDKYERFSTLLRVA
ncbi:hypothetical protein LINPERHAP2_LOCUS21957, partial [Linum perenne]